MFFLTRDSHSKPLFKNCNILRFLEKIALENSIMICKSFKHEIPEQLNSWFGLCSNFHAHKPRWSNLGSLNVSQNKTMWKKF